MGTRWLLDLFFIFTRIHCWLKIGTSKILFIYLILFKFSMDALNWQSDCKDIGTEKVLFQINVVILNFLFNNKIKNPKKMYHSLPQK